jgi:hypothetical protein
MAENGMGWIPGLGDNKPQSRLLGKSFFGYVPDAFSMKTPAMPSEKPSRRDSEVSTIVHHRLETDKKLKLLSRNKRYVRTLSDSMDAC